MTQEARPLTDHLRDGKNWLNGGQCCGQKDSAGICAAPACVFGEALKWFFAAADEIDRQAIMRSRTENSPIETVGTFKCPICGSDEPHYHDANLQWKRLPADQLGWLIETGDHQYWNGKKANSDGFTHDPNDAVRFARFEDSERVIHWLMSEYRVFLVSRQHSWMGGNAQKALATQREGE